MAVKYEMVIEVAPDGTIRIKTVGMKGSECEEELKPFEKALGTPSEKTRTEEFYEKPATQKRKITSSTK